MAAEASRAPIVREQTNFASAWLASWKTLGGTISATRDGRGMIGLPLVAASDDMPATPAMPLAGRDQRRAGRTALLAMLDAAGPEARRFVFALAASGNAA